VIREALEAEGDLAFPEDEPLFDETKRIRSRSEVMDGARRVTMLRAAW